MEFFKLARNEWNLSFRVGQDTPKCQFVHHERCVFPATGFIPDLPDMVTSDKGQRCNLHDGGRYGYICQPFHVRKCQITNGSYRVVFPVDVQVIRNDGLSNRRVGHTDKLQLIRIRFSAIL